MECKVNDTLRFVITLTELLHTGDVRCAILAILSELGFQSSLDGFGYLRKAIFIRYENPDLRITEIYDEIIRMSGNRLSVRQIEQSMNNAISETWDKRNKEKWDLFFSEEKTGTTEKPANKDFVAEMACIMELWASHCKEVVCNGVK